MAKKRTGIVALLTDFGLRDPFVGAIKGVILSIHPECRIVDISHLIAPQDIREAAFALRSARRSFPRGTVFLCVVDPGVGGSRRPIAAEGGGQFFVAPDNGLLTLVEPLQRVVRISDDQLFLKPVSRTFHGRDIFAPVAAHLARGRALSKIGAPVARIRRVRIPEPIRKGNEVRGEVVRVDRFGNLVTNLRPADLPGRKGLQIRIGKRRIAGLCRTYGDVPEGTLAAVIGSDGFLEIAIRGGSAARRLKVKVGARVTARGATKGRPPKRRA